MGNDRFDFKQFTIRQPENVFRVGTDGVLLGAWAATGGSDPGRILDIGTGTGLIALMMAQRFPQASITAIEPDRDSYQTAAANVSMSPWPVAIGVLNLTLEEFAASTRDRFDLVVANPPFFRDALKNPDPAKAGFRHAGALTTKMIIDHSGALLREDGRLCMVLPWAEGNVFIAEAALKGLYCSAMVKVRPLPHSPFNRMLLEFTKDRRVPRVKILTLGHPSKGGYTEDYMDLTREFYLSF
jgi:tRNA1Val (adenine37-N6)-methyltransferase